MLSRINAATSRTAVSGPMAHDLPIEEGSRFNFSHNFVEAPIGQLQDELEGKESSFICRTCFKSDESSQQWQNRSVNDYIYWPKQLEDLYFFQVMMHYRKQYRMKENRQDSDDEESDDDDDDDSKFKDGHPGHGFAYLKKIKLWKIPITSIPEGKFCQLADLKKYPNLPMMM